MFPVFSREKKTKNSQFELLFCFGWLAIGNYWSWYINPLDRLDATLLPFGGMGGYHQQ